MESLGYADSVELIKTVFVAITQKLSLETKMRAGYQQTWTFQTRDWEKISEVGEFPSILQYSESLSRMEGYRAWNCQMPVSVCVVFGCVIV